MKYRHIKGLQYHKPRFVDIDKVKYQNLLEGKDVVLNEKDIEALDSLGIRYKKIEKKVVKKEEK